RGRVGAVSAFTLHLAVVAPAGAVRIAVRLAEPAPWEQVRPAVCRAAGLPDGAVLYHGVGAVEPGWLVGLPPLVHGCVVSTWPQDELRTHAPLVAAVIAGPD